jgi:hypothetical protein
VKGPATSSKKVVGWPRGPVDIAAPLGASVQQRAEEK